MFGALGSDKYVEYCRDIHRSGEYLLDVINDVLDMSKIEAGRLKLDLENVELDRELDRRAARGHHARAGEEAHGHLQDRIRHPPAGRPARAQADRAQPSVQRRQIHPRERPHHGARPRVARRRGDRHPGFRHRHRARRAAEARPAVRAGRKPAHQDPARLGPGPRHRQVADRAAWRRDAHPLDARRRHHGGGAPAARRAAG